ncbi:MAG: N-acetylneuraminate synthase family protein [Kiritimatiellae bacterium]|nr:N-acetylneuraminate synthase family protein [Verrucomicrobiota bacterium]MCG2680936.1 N-acetylneuraminate synthase family protein [Kiritimatiellia bacterium]
MKLGDREVKDFSIPYIIAEIGANHNGDMNLARKMIDSAKSCGCDAVKFQSWTPDSLIAQEEYDRNQQYDDSPKKHFGSLKDMVGKYYLRADQHWELQRYCNSIGIQFCSSPFSKEEANLLEEMKVPFYKIASMDINNLSFLSHVARKQKPILLSTGMATLAEIENAIKTIEYEGNSQVILLHCIAIYPPEYEDIHLNNIPMLRQVFGFPVGFSDHSIGVSIPLAAVALGTCLIEKHFTLDKDLPGWDHAISADPSEMKTIVLDAKNVYRALGSYRRIVSSAELEKRKKFRRSIVLTKDLTAGHILDDEDITFKRPGTQIPPDMKIYVLGRKLTRDLAADDVLRWEDLV